MAYRLDRSDFKSVREFLRSTGHEGIRTPAPRLQSTNLRSNNSTGNLNSQRFLQIRESAFAPKSYPHCGENV